MKTILIALMALTFSSYGYAYQPGFYKCANPVKGLPDNIYNIQTLKIDGLSLPYVEVTRTMKLNPTGSFETKIQGIATLFVTDGIETLKIAAVEILLVDGKMENCTN
jgi:hypothetical protein